MQYASVLMRIYLMLTKCTVSVEKKNNALPWPNFGGCNTNALVRLSRYECTASLLRMSQPSQAIKVGRLLKQDMMQQKRRYHYSKWDTKRRYRCNGNVGTITRHGDILPPLSFKKKKKKRLGGRGPILTSKAPEAETKSQTHTSFYFFYFFLVKTNPYTY